MGVNKIYKDLLGESEDAIYCHLLQCLSGNNKKENLAKLAGMKALIKKKDSTLWTWTIILGIFTIMIDAGCNLFAKWQTNIRIPNLEIRGAIYKCKGVIERISTNNMITITTTLDVDMLLKIILIALLVGIPIGVIIAMHRHEKCQYVLSIVESVEFDYKNGHISLNDMDFTTTKEIAQQSEVDEPPHDLDNASYKKFVVYVKT